MEVIIHFGASPLRYHLLLLIGVLAYRWNEKTEAVFVRSLELIPFFAAMDLYQDQAFLRHALFEALMRNGLVIRQGSMDRYCRHGW